MSPVKTFKSWPAWLKWIAGIASAFIIGFTYYVAPAPLKADRNEKSICRIETKVDSNTSELNSKIENNRDRINKVDKTVSQRLERLDTNVEWIRRAIEEMKK